jgi:hypothetical protein
LLRHEIWACPSRTAAIAGCGQRLGVDVPLVGEKRLEHRAGAVAVRHRRVSARSCRAAALSARDDRLRASKRFAVQRFRAARSGSGLQKRLVVLERQMRASSSSTLISGRFVPLADLEIVEVVRRRDLHRAGALFRIGVVVGDDRNAPADQRQDRVLADQMR